MLKQLLFLSFTLYSCFSFGDTPLGKLIYTPKSNEDSLSWINQSTISFNDVVNDYITVLDSNHIYGLGYKGKFPKPCLGKHLNVVVKAKVRLSSLNSGLSFALSFARGDSTIVWDSKSVKQESSGQWFDVKLEFKIPSSFVNESNNFTIYGWNSEGKTKCEYYDLQLEFNELDQVSFLPPIKFSKEKKRKIADKLISGILFDVYIDTVLNNVRILSKEKDTLINALGFYFESDDTPFKPAFIQNFKNYSIERNGEKPIIVFEYRKKFLDVKVKVEVDNINGVIRIEPEIKSIQTLRIKQASLLIKYGTEVNRVMKKNGQCDTSFFKKEYWLEKEGVVFKGKENDLITYRNLKTSSLQLNTIDKFLILNLEYCGDHPMHLFPRLAKSKSLYFDESSVLLKQYEKIVSKIEFRLINKGSSLIQVMKNPDGYLASLIWTEHADFSDLRIQRAVNFGSEKITNADSAIGGFVGNKIPVTKSVFYDNPTNQKNSEKDSLFLENSLSIKGSPEFKEMLIQLKRHGQEICLHTPDPFSTTRRLAEEALQFMHDNYDAVSWIDHGYDNAETSNREDIVCDGLNPRSDYYMADLWKWNNTKYFWNSFYEDSGVYKNSSYNSFIITPYSGWDDAFPTPEYFRNPLNNDLISWRTTYTLDPPDGSLWNYYFNDQRLNDLVQSGGNCIIHAYPARVDSTTGFYSFSNGVIVVNNELDKMLKRLRNYKEDKKVWITTVKEMLDYRLSLENVTVEPSKNESYVIFNNNNKSIKNFSLISAAKSIEAGEKNIVIKNYQGNLIAIMDLAPMEKVVLHLKSY